MALRFLIQTTNEPGQALYVVIINSATDEFWNPTLNGGQGGWEAYNAGHWAQYAIPLTEKAGSGYYSAAFPAGIGQVLTTEVIYNNAAPTLGDMPAGIGQSQGTNVAAIAGDATVPDLQQRALAAMAAGAVIAGTLQADSFPTNLVNANVNAFQGRAIYFATGALAGQGSTITQYDPATGTVSVAGPFTGAPAPGDLFVIS